MWFKQTNDRACFMPSNITLYLTLGLLIICVSKYACAETNFLNEIERSLEKTVDEPLSPTTKRGRKTGGRRSAKPRTVSLKFSKIPRVAVFQADGVFWPYKVEREVVGPFAVHRKDVLPKEMDENHIRTPMQTKMTKNYKCENEIFDNTGKLIKAYDGIKDILQAVKKKGTKLGLRETTTEGATLLHLIQLCDFELFKFKEVDDDLEIDHIKSIQSRAEVEFKDMAYFGTNETTLREIHDLNVTTVKINIGEGLKMYHIEEANKLYATMHQ